MGGRGGAPGRGLHSLRLPNPTAACAASQISAAVAAVVQEHCGVPPARFYLKFYDVGASDFGWNGSTF